MKKGSKKLQKFEQFKEEPAVAIDIERLTNLIGMAGPILDEISRIVDQDDDIPPDMYNRIKDAIEVMDELKMTYGK